MRGIIACGQLSVGDEVGQSDGGKTAGGGEIMVWWSSLTGGCRWWWVVGRMSSLKGVAQLSRELSRRSGEADKSRHDRMQISAASRRLPIRGSESLLHAIRDRIRIRIRVGTPSDPASVDSPSCAVLGGTGPQRSSIFHVAPSPLEIPSDRRLPNASSMPSSTGHLNIQPRPVLPSLSQSPPSPHRTTRWPLLRSPHRQHRHTTSSRPTCSHLDFSALAARTPWSRFSIEPLTR